MSDQATPVEQTPRSVAILGADALLVALPSTPTQLANACFAGGYAEVFPATWGDELLAAGCLEQLESRTGPAIFCACPLVAEQLRGAAELKRFIVPFISPPVAVARYLRTLHAGEALRITYVGDCPGADDDSIDVRLSPHELLSTLSKRGILPATQRPDLGTHAAHDRRRFYSMPGGVPSPQWLGAQWPKRTLVDVHAGDALASLANQTQTRGNTLIDFAPHLGCACAGAVSGNNAEDARKAVLALEPPRAQSEVVSAAVHVEVSLSPIGEAQHSDVTWGDFLAALPAALAMHPEGSAAPRGSAVSRTAPRRALQKKSALPRAYMAARAGARRERPAPPPPRAKVESARPMRPIDIVAARVETSAEMDDRRREEPSSARPSPWIGRRASQEGMTGPRGMGYARAGLAAGDRWLLAALMLGSSVLVAVLTSALTVRGIGHASVPTIAARAETTVTIAAAPRPLVHDTAVTSPAVRTPDSVLVAASPRSDSAPNHEEMGGAVAPSPAGAPKLSPMPARQQPAPPVRTLKRTTARIERHPVAIAEHVRTTPTPVAAPAITPAITASATPTPASTVTELPAAIPTSVAPAAAPPASTAPATVVTNAQYLEELRAIHAEIDARKHHMDSLTASLDSLKHVKP